MGHNLGMYHDLNTCTCGAPVCVMSAVLSFRPPIAFTSCSIEDMRNFIYSYFPDCLLNIPQTSQVLTPPVCGNKFIENGEQCDCGEPQIKPAGSICRPAKDECDLTDMCDGKSPVCPKDSFKVNGFPCMDGNGACYMGKCPVIRNQCIGIWGPGAIPGYDDCFSINTEGSLRGHCRQEGERYVPCGIADVKCGLLFCSGGTDSADIPGYLINFGQCKTLVFNKGIVVDGTKCSATNVCINKKCTKIEEAYMTAGCQSKCTGHAVCDHELECHCEEGWAPPDCTVRGGSDGFGFTNGYGITDGRFPSFSVLHLFSWWWTSLLPIFSIFVSTF
ncbi:disintegrin and metalloproteinase domain-containing protein 28-like isoform X3 [Ranitomeya imitator]|uniref:disintegrin and metalloproteinase domain-containing protein 28-like isoform X3 n=1 Tax=Ranitomeya imitator TaxID=111125 RepID=UPI0037E8235D